MPESTSAPFLTGRFPQAFALASEIHATQLRKGTAVPYVAHLMAVAALVLEHGGDEDAAIAALLHDSVEDSFDGAAVAATIRGRFGDRVADVVLACSDAVAVPGQRKAPWRERKASYIARLVGEHDSTVLLVSACDKLHNAHTIVADLRTAGPAVWQRFSEKDPAAQVWNFKSLAATYADRIPADLADELNRVIYEMESLAYR